MSAIPANLARVPNLLVSNAALSTMTRTGLDLLKLSEQIATGSSLLRISDDAVRASVALVLDERLENAGQRFRNLDHAQALLDTADQALLDARDLAVEAQSIASSQIGVGSDSTTRRNQALVINSILQEMMSVANRSFADVHVFAGATVPTTPFQAFLGGVRYAGAGEGLRTDLGAGLDFPVTVSGEAAFGALSARLKGDVDLNPMLTRSTRIADLGGARQLGVSLGQIEVTIDNGTPVTVAVDLAGAESVGDALDRIEAAIRAADPAALDGAFPSATVAGEQFSFDVAAGYTVTFQDVGAGTTAQDLGIADFGYADGAPVKTAGLMNLDPRLTDLTLLSDLDPASAMTFGDIRFRNGALTGVVTTTPTMTIGQLRAQINALGLGVRAEISPDGASLDVVNEVSGLYLSVEEVGGGTAATSLGIRSMTGSTLISDFNFGRGVEIAHGAVDPITGLPDADRNVDFRVTTRSGATFTVDLEPGHMGTVSDVIARINAEAAGQGLAVPADFEAALASDGNGIVLLDNTGPVTGQTSVARLNGYAAEDLGLLNGSFTAGATAVFAAADRAKVRVDSVFTTLMEMRTALETNNERGITLAGEFLAPDVDRLHQARALVGARAARIEAGRAREQDVQLLNEKLRSQMKDLDYTTASTRYALLQLAQQAGLTTTAQSFSRSLLDFLG
ncbi:MAG: hypothetical protein IBJ10_05560 [Phycisphaerales bacterium]|nr:hypothetical protein [Phycisphaerales bacterium]